MSIEDFDLGSSEETTIYAFALSYRDACKRVQEAWGHLFTTRVDTPERKDAVNAYVAACQKAKDLRCALVQAASGGINEVGVSPPSAGSDSGS